MMGPPTGGPIPLGDKNMTEHELLKNIEFTVRMWIGTGKTDPWYGKLQTLLKEIHDLRTQKEIDRKKRNFWLGKRTSLSDDP